MNPITKTFAGPLLTALALGAFSLPATAAQFEEGQHYERISPAQPTSSAPDKIEVAEVFTYECIHCFHFEPQIQDWLQDKPVDVAFVRIPATFNEQWKPSARAYYAADILGVLEQVSMPLFRAIHLERRNLRSEDALASFFAEHGVDEEEFRKVYDSFAVQTKMQRADQLARRYKVLSTPTIVVNGKYKTDGNMAGGSWQALLQVVDHLVEKERAER